MFNVPVPIFLQIFCKIILNSKVIVKSMKDPDDNYLLSINGLNGWLQDSGMFSMPAPEYAKSK